MTLKAVVPNLDEVPQQFHELYTERNGQFEISAIEGMRTQADVDRLQTALTKERDDHKGTKTKFSAFANLDPVEVADKLARFPELEAAAEGKLDENKINAIVESRIKAKLAPVERERDVLKGQLTEKDELITGFQRRDTQRKISDKVREAATSAKIIPEAFDDALMLADRVFEVAEDGRVVTRDNVGVTPGIEPSVWFTELQAKRPHWWGPTVGAGASGSRVPGGGQNPFSHEHWNMTEQGALVRTNRVRAEQLAKSAGTTIGGARPQPAK